MQIVITGSIAYDYLMRFPGRFKEYFIADALDHISLSFLVDDMSKHWGGAAANIAYTMAKFGMRPKLMGTVGGDFGEYRQWLEGKGVDCSTVVQIDEVLTASFFGNTDEDNNQLAFFYGGAMNLARNYSLADVTSECPDMVVVSPNDPVAMVKLTDECRARGIPFVYDPSQQAPRLGGEALRRGMLGARLMVVNAYEASVICSKTGLTLDELRDQIEILIVTASENGSTVYTAGEAMEIPAFAPSKIIDPTGAGDAYRAGLMAGIARGLPLEASAKVGALSATFALEQIGTQNHDFTVAGFVERFRSLTDDGGDLDRLLET
ncbi:MAG: carbohydrate kinase family protein [Chloroflexota bacterium]|nr:carbohydrate kinase family protein [Chloroflexota bacterium]